MSDPTKFFDQATGKEIEVNPEGSLGMLALGDIAVKPWRQKRIESGYEKDLRERMTKQKEYMEKRREEAKRRREQKANEQKKS